MRRFRPYSAIVAVTLVALYSLQALADSGEQIRQDVLSKAQRSITLYRGASSEAAFTPKALKEVGSREDLVRAVASRLTSTSNQVTGLTNSPQTAGAFALGVKDGDPNTIRNMGLSSGFIGVTKALNMPASEFADLLKKHGATKNGLNTLLSTMAASNVVVDASGAINALARHYPGILTHGFQEMISASLSRESEYLVFGKQPGFNRVHRIQKIDVIDVNGSVSGPIFKSDLHQKLRRPENPKPKLETYTREVKTRTKAETTKRPVAKPATVTTMTKRPPTSKPAAGRWGFFRRVFSFRKKLTSGARR
jgi:hypothetical protein